MIAINPWFDSPGKILALELQAEDWLGTPFFTNSQAKHRGVSCQKLAAALYRDVGWIDLDVPEVPMSYARFNRESLVEKFLDGRPEFAAVPPGPLPGDLLGFTINRTVHHVGIALRGGRFVHCIEGAGVQIAHQFDATWESRLARIWRPLHV